MKMPEWMNRHACVASAHRTLSRGCRELSVTRVTGLRFERKKTWWRPASAKGEEHPLFRHATRTHWRELETGCSRHQTALRRVRRSAQIGNSTDACRTSVELARVCRKLQLSDKFASFFRISRGNS